MAITNILRLIQRSGIIAEKTAKKQLKKFRSSEGGKQSAMNSSGELSESIKFKLEVEGMMAKLTLESLDYGKILDDGFTKIPFTPPTSKKAGSKKRSVYIHNLALWAARKFYGGNYKAGLKAAFAIAHKQKKESKAPANPGWIKEIKDDLDAKLHAQMSLDTMAAVTMDVESILNKKIP